MHKLMLAITLIVGVAVLPFDAVHAGPGSCSGTDRGCTRLFGAGLAPGVWSDYRFNGNDSNLFNNYYVSENCLGGCAGTGLTDVADSIEQYRINDPGWARMCRYAGANYSTLLGSITAHGAWYTASGKKGQSINYTNGISCV